MSITYAPRGRDRMRSSELQTAVDARRSRFPSDTGCSRTSAAIRSKPRASTAPIIAAGPVGSSAARPSRSCRSAARHLVRGPVRAPSTMASGRRRSLPKPGPRPPRWSWRTVCQRLGEIRVRQRPRRRYLGSFGKPTPARATPNSAPPRPWTTCDAALPRASIPPSFVNRPAFATRQRRVGKPTREPDRD